MNRRLRLAAGFVSVILIVGACADPPPSSEEQIADIVRAASIPMELSAGETAYTANCATCHGERGLGTERGPPFINIIYEPAHHADIAFTMAAERGVQAHHWNFGNMPPVPAVSTEQVAQIVAYIRYLQRQVGIQ
jgi:mono/diheme cytochrome c family protein